MEPFSLSRTLLGFLQGEFVHFQQHGSFLFVLGSESHIADSLVVRNLILNKFYVQVERCSTVVVLCLQVSA